MKNVNKHAARLNHPLDKVQVERAKNNAQAVNLVAHLVHRADSPKDEFDTLRVIAQAHDVPIARLTRALLELRLAPKAIKKPSLLKRVKGWFK